MKNEKKLNQSNQVDYLIVGAGASGVYVSYLLSKKFLTKSVMMLEKSRGIGGRLATKRLFLDQGTVAEIDLGAVVVHRSFRSTLLAASSALDVGITSWEGVDVLEGLSNRFLKHADEQASQVLLHCETHVTSMNYDQNDGVWRLCCTQQDSEQSYIARQVILSMPAPQVHMLLSNSKNIGDFPLTKVASVEMVCRWTWVLAVKGSIPSQAVYRPIAHEMIETVFVINQKPGVESIDGINLLHVSMTLQWSASFVDLDKKVAAEQWNDRVIEALSDIIGVKFIDKCIGIHCHKWRYGHAKNPLTDGFLVNDRQDLWCVGDWLAGYGVDDSFYSAEQMVLSATSD